MKMEKNAIRRVTLVAALASLVGAGAWIWGLALIGQAPGRLENRGTAKRDWTQDMQMKILQPFSLASVGDLIIIRPASQYDDPGFQAAIKVIRDSDVGFGNFESMIRDELNFEGPLGGMFGSKEVAKDLKAMGFKLVNRAGNHLMDSNQEGLFETMRLMEDAGLVYGGAGRNLNDARAAHFLETPKGRVGVVGMYSEVGGVQSRLAASYRVGNTGGKPGLNPINLTQSIAVTPDQLAALKKVRDAIFEHRTEYSNPVDVPTDGAADQLQLFGTLYKVGDKPGTLNYTMNAGDLRDTLRSIKNGKEYSDYMIATIHAHQGDTVLQPFLYEDHPPDFLIQLAHQSIDNGADVFVGHGPHLLRGIEIYKGKPIFYDLGEFFREWDWGCDCDTDPTSTQTPAETTTGRLMARDVIRPINYESAIAVTKYDKGKLIEVRVYPIESREAGPVSQRGIPRMAPPDVAQKILHRLQTLSEPLGTKIEIEGNCGVIHVGQ
jgi:hypothetical protein